MFCNNCGNKLKEGASFCNKCGKPVAKKTNISNDATQVLDKKSNNKANDVTQVMEKQTPGKPEDTSPFQPYIEADKTAKFVAVNPTADQAPKNTTKKQQAATKKKNSGSNKALIIWLSVLAGLIIILIAGLVAYLIIDPNAGVDSINITDQVITSTKDNTGSSDDKNSYMISDSASRYLSESELQAMSTYDLYLARNEIYARHGRDFKKDDLKKYFGSKSWYHVQYSPDYFDAHTSSLLNDFERKNADLMLQIEKGRNSPYLAP